MDITPKGANTETRPLLVKQTLTLLLRRPQKSLLTAAQGPSTATALLEQALYCGWPATTDVASPRARTPRRCSREENEQIAEAEGCVSGLPVLLQLRPAIRRARIAGGNLTVKPLTT